MLGRNSIIAIGLAAMTASVATASAHSQSDAIELDGDEASFTLNVGSAKAKVGQATTIAVSVTANKGFKCNDQYPHKIKDLVAEEGAEVGATKVDGSVAGDKIAFSIPVTATAPGTHKVSGEARFSVCNDSQCVIKKVPISASITGER